MATENYKGFTFRFVNDLKSSGKVRVYVENAPSYNGRSSELSVIHRWPANHDGFSHPPYICFKENFKPDNLAEARDLAQKWADGTIEYIRSGVSISEQFRRR